MDGNPLEWQDRKGTRGQEHKGEARFVRGLAGMAWSLSDAMGKYRSRMAGQAREVLRGTVWKPKERIGRNGRERYGLARRGQDGTGPDRQDRIGLDRQGKGKELFGWERIGRPLTISKTMVMKDGRVRINVLALFISEYRTTRNKSVIDSGPPVQF